MYKLFPLLFVALMALGNQLNAQVGIGTNSIDYNRPKEYTIGGITVQGAQNFDTQAIISFSGLSVGDIITVPGDRITKAIKNLWKQQLFADIKILQADIRGDEIFLNIKLTERPRLSRFKFEGVSKGEAESLREKINLIRGTVVNENLLNNTSNIIKDFFIEKGFLNTEVDIEDRPDTLVTNSVLLIINIDKHKKVKINELSLNGVEKLKEGKIRRAMKKTKEKKWWRFFSASKFIRKLYETDKQNIIDKYNEYGYRNAEIVSDTVYRYNNKTVNVEINIDEGNVFYFGDISWVGNTKHSSQTLEDILGIEKGEIYDRSKFESRLFMNPNGGDVSSLYLDDGYLAFQAIPTEVRVENDTIDLQIRIYEGRQYRINKVIVKGNTKTNDRVIIREIRTKPGDLFSRSEIIRTQRELAQLGYFDPEAFDIVPIQNDQDGTVDLQYTVVERPSDQIELSGGFGNGFVVGTVGVSFTNFSLRNVFTPGAWRPLPSGDGQKLSLRIQSNGRYYQSYNLAFTEPWLGGKKPNSLSFSVQHSVQNLSVPRGDYRERLKISGASLGLGKRLEWPDDYFQLFASINYQYYDLENFGRYFVFDNGYSNNLSFTAQISRNSIFDPIFPKYGSNIKISTKFTLPYSAFDNVDYAGNISDQERYKWIEYYKWKFTAEWYTELAPKLVLMTRSGFGFLGFYNQDKGLSPFERFYLGGSALSNFTLDGREIIGLRGYDDQSLTPQNGSAIISKQTLEMRYLISPNPSATIFVLGFAEAGNTYSGMEDFDAFRLYRSAGLGLRVFLPMFGLLGLDYGWRFDDVPSDPNMPRSQFHFTIGMNLGEL